MVPGEVMEPTEDLKMGDSKCAAMPAVLERETLMSQEEKG